MSNPTFDTVETTLKSLKDIVDRIHLQSAETSQLVEDMELLVAEMKTKTREESKVNKLDSTTISIHKPAIVPVAL